MVDLRERMSKVLFWPPSPGPWIVGLVAFAILSAYDFQRIPVFGSLLSPTASSGLNRGVVLPAACALNFTALFGQVRQHFVAARSALLPATGTFVLLTAGYLLLYGWVATSSTLSDWLSRGIVSQAGVFLTATASWLWIGPKPGLDTIRSARTAALEVLRNCSSGRTVSAAEKKTLDAAVEALIKAVDAAPTVRRPEDRDVLRRWSAAAKKVEQRLKQLDSADLRPDDCAALRPAQQELDNDR